MCNNYNKKGILSRIEDIQPPNHKAIINTEDGQGHNYLSVLEADGLKNLEMKEKLRKEYFRRIKKIL